MQLLSLLVIAVVFCEASSSGSGGMHKISRYLVVLVLLKEVLSLWWCFPAVDAVRRLNYSRSFNVVAMFED